MQTERRAALTLHSIRVRTVIAGSAFTIFALDFGSKKWAESFLRNRPAIKVLGEFLQVTFATNSGAAFSLATNATVFLSSFAIIFAAAILAIARRITSRWWGLVAGLTLGGIAGNLWNRLFSPPGGLHGEVVDWIQLPHWPIFNIADTAVVLAACLVVILAMRNIPPILPKNNSPRGGA